MKRNIIKTKISMTNKIIGLLILFFMLTNTAFSYEASNFDSAVQAYRSGNYYESLSILDRLESNDPKNLYIKYYKAISLVKLGKFDDAKNNYVYIIGNSDDSTLTENAKKGLSLLDPDYYASAEKKNYSLVEPATGNVKQNQTVNTVKQNSLANNNVKNTSGVTSEELNNLVSLLAKNPSAIQTLVKLAKTSNPNLQVQEPNQNVDPESLAKWVKMMTLNSQMDLLKSSSNNDDDSNKSNDSFFDMSKYYANMYKVPGQGNENSNEAIKNYLNSMSGKGNMNPDMLNMIFQQGMSGNTSNNLGF